MNWIPIGKDALQKGKKLKEFRLNILQMGLYKFADWLGVKPTHICNVEHGRKFDDTPTIEEYGKNQNVNQSQTDKN